ncbi:MAG: SDR family NAD(P)-dependent oxidoreductase, partial [Acidimicrobiia bacterium]
MSEDFEGRVALVTGASRGLGRAMALRLASSGHSVGVNFSTSADAAEEVVSEIRARGGTALAVGADVADEDQVAEMFARVQADLGPVAILVNNAGMTRDNLLLRMSTQDFDRVIATNLRSAFLCTKSALRSMLKAKWGR